MYNFSKLNLSNELYCWLTMPQKFEYVIKGRIIPLTPLVVYFA